MRKPVKIYRDPIKHNLIYMLRQNLNTDEHRIMVKAGTDRWRRVPGVLGNVHLFKAIETMNDFIFDNGLLEEEMDEDLAGV